MHLGILLLGIAFYRERGRAVRHAVGAVGAAVVVVADLAVMSRLRPELFPAAHQTGAFLPGSSGRLSWPLNYWNALAALMALGLPLRCARDLCPHPPSASSCGGRHPDCRLCGYLTFSRGGAIAGGDGVIVFLAPRP